MPVPDKNRGPVPSDPGGVSGQAGNLRGAKVDGGNIYEGPRSNDFPNKPLQRGLAGVLFEEATRKLGYHPLPRPSANASAAYTNPEGAVMGECVYCGFCERFGCESNAKASPNVNVLSVMMTDPKFDRYVFIERREERCEHLEGLRPDFPALAHKIEIRQGDANAELQALCAEDWRSRRAISARSAMR